MHSRWLSERHAALVLLLAVLVRGGVLVARYDHLAVDPDGYKALAHNVIEHGVFGREQTPSAYRPPLYPLLLAAGFSGPWADETAIAVMHLMLGLATVWLTLYIGHCWQLGVFASLAGMLVACDPILLNQSALAMTETLATFLAVASLSLISAATDAAGRRRTILTACCGASFALAALCRPTFLATLILVATGLVWTLATWRERVRTSVVLLLAAGIVLLPWAGRNWLRFGRPMVTTTHGGYTVLLGNNPSYYKFLRFAPSRAVWSAEELDRALSAERGRDETVNDRREYQRAWRTIRGQPALFAYASMRRVASLWGVLPHQVMANEPWPGRCARYATALWYVVLFSLAISAVTARLARPPWLWAILFILSFTAVHLLYWTDMRMRAPLMPAVCLLAAAGVRRWREGSERTC